MVRVADVTELDAKKRIELLKQRARGLIESGDLVEAQRALVEIMATNAGHATTPPVGIDRLVDAAMARAERRASGEDKPVATPWKHLNVTLGGGLWPGAHFLVAGTGVGKSQLSFQLALHAAKDGVPVGLVALELDEMQMVIRLAAEHAGLQQWSDVYNGKASQLDLQRVKKAAAEVGQLPIVTDFGQAMGWPASRLEHVVRSMRDRYPDGPALVVLDFVQLIAPEEGPKSLDLRERIGRAGYMARNLARQHGVSIIIVSSTARENYSKLSQPMRKLGLSTITRGDKTYRNVHSTDQLIGLGKESGEIEYAADSVHVLLHPQTSEEVHPEIEQTRSLGKVVVCASVKVRAGIPSWFALGFVKGRFIPLCDDAINSLGGGEDPSAGRPSRDSGDLVRAVVDAVRKAEEQGTPLRSRNAICGRVTGTKGLVLDAIKTALLEGYVFDATGEFLASSDKAPPLAPGQAGESDIKSELF